MTPKPDLSMTFEEAVALLAEPHVGVLSTIDAGGFPHSVGIYYVSEADGSDVVARMWVYGKSQKAVNVERTGKAALLVEAGEPYQDLRGVLLRGDARVIRDHEPVLDLGKRIYERYFEPRLGVRLEEGPIANIEKQSLKRVVIELRASRIASWDHGRGQAFDTGRGAG